MPRLVVPVVPRWVRWASVLAVAAAIFYLSVLAVPPENPVVGPPGPPDLIPLDKWRHFLAYAGLAGSLAYATADWERSTAGVAAFVVGVSVLYGVGIEGIQATIPHRYFSPADAYANALGAVLAVPWFAVRSRVELVRVFDDDTATN
jgi:VanZ family protein